MTFDMAAIDESKLSDSVLLNGAHYTCDKHFNFSREMTTR